MDNIRSYGNGKATAIRYVVISTEGCARAEKSLEYNQRIYRNVVEATTQGSPREKEEPTTAGGAKERGCFYGWDTLDFKASPFRSV